MACWKPLTRAEIGSFRGYGLGEHSIADFLDDEDQGLVRRWRAWFTAPMPPGQGEADPVLPEPAAAPAAYTR